MKKVITKPIGKTIKMGDSGAKVEEAQLLLKKAGSKIQVNGEFGIGMMSAVKSFQKKHDLKVTGIIDLMTWEKLHGKKAAKAPAKKPVVKKEPTKKTSGRKKA